MVFIIQGRSTSKRLPNKSLMDLCGKPLIQHTIDRCLDTGFDVIVCTPKGDAVADYCKKNSIRCHEGSENDVVSRFVGAIKEFDVHGRFCRITADSPLVNTALCFYMTAIAEQGDLDYFTNLPAIDGQEIQICSVRLLNWIDATATDKSDREHVMTILDKEKPEWIRSGHYQPPYLNEWFPKISIDTKEDFDRVEQIIKQLEVK